MSIINLFFGGAILNNIPFTKYTQDITQSYTSSFLFLNSFNNEL